MLPEGKPTSSAPEPDLTTDPPTRSKSKSKSKRRKSDQGPRSVGDASQADNSPSNTLEEGKPTSYAPQSDLPTDPPTRSKSKSKGKRRKSDQGPLSPTEASQADISHPDALPEGKATSAHQRDPTTDPPTSSKSKGKRRKSDQGARSPTEASQADMSASNALRDEKGTSSVPQQDLPTETPTRSKSKGKRSKSDLEPRTPVEASQVADTREAPPVEIPSGQQAPTEPAARSKLSMGAPRGPTSSAAAAAPHGEVPPQAGGVPAGVPDSLDCWLVVLSSSIYIFFAMALMKSESALFPGIRDMFNVTRETASWPLTISTTLSQLAGPIYGVLGLWLSDRILLVIGAFCCSVPVMVSSLTQEVWQISITYGVFTGLGVACEEVMPFAIVSRHFVRYRGGAMGVLFVVTALSGLVSPLGITALTRKLGFRTALVVLGVLELNMFLGAVFVERVPPAPAAPEPGRNDDQRPGPSGRGSPVAQCDSALTKLMRNLRSLATIPFFHVAVSRAISLFGLQTFLLTAQDFGKDNGLGYYEAVTLVQAYAAGDMVARIGTGIVLDYKLLSGAYLMLWTFAAHTVSMFVLGFGVSYWTMMASCFISGICGGSRIFAANIMVAEYFEDRVLQLSLGVMNFVAGVAIFGRPPLVGYSRDELGTYKPLYLGLGGSYGLFAASWVASCLWQRFQNPKGDGPVKELGGGAQPVNPT